jgi:hypothetical protein
MTYWQEPQRIYAAGVWEFYGWKLAWSYAAALCNKTAQMTAEQYQASVVNAVRVLTPQYGAGVEVALTTFNQFFPQYLAKCGAVTPVPGVTSSAPAEPKPNPAYPVGLQLLAGPSGPSWSDPVVGLITVLGFRRITILDNGQMLRSDWKPLPAVWTVRTFPQQTQGAASGWWSWTPLQATDPTWAKNAAESVTWNTVFLPRNFTRDEQQAAAWLASQGFGFAVPSSWGTPIAEVGSSGAPPVVPPDLPPGTEVKVPLPGSGDPVLVREPGATDFTPIPTSSKPVETWVSGKPVTSGGNGLVMSEGLPGSAEGGFPWWLVAVGVGLYAMQSKRGRP